MTQAQIYNQMCDLADGQLNADELYHCGYSLLVLGLSKMTEEQREAELSVLGPGICHGLDRLEELRQLKQINRRLNGKGGLTI